jgi:hypothetical protein
MARIISIQRIISEYNNNWKPRALGCKPVEARQKLPYWQDRELDPNVWNNILWRTSTPEWMDETSLDSDSDSMFETGMEAAAPRIRKFSGKARNVSLHFNSD